MLVRTLWLIAAIVVVAVAVFLSFAVGSVAVPFNETLAALTGATDTQDQMIVAQLRGPRTVTGLLAGSALGISGALLQAATRNPFASPSLMGVTAGGGLAVIIAVSTFGAQTGGLWLAAFLGGIAAAGLTLWLAGGSASGATPVTLALSGAVVSALAGAWSTALLVANTYDADAVRSWLAGSLAGRSQAGHWQLWAGLAAGIIAAVAMSRTLDVASLGDDTAASLGVNPNALRIGASVCAVGLAAIGIAVAGPIGFVGLLVPHLARRCVGGRTAWLVVMSAIFGAALLLLADIVGRVIAPPAEVQAGVLTAIIGAPVLVALAIRTRTNV